MVLLALVVLLALCFAAGIVARNSLGRKFAAAFEKKLLLFFPRYAILKDQMSDSIGGEQSRPRMKPVVVRFDDYTRIAFETDRDEESGCVSVYLPGSPDPWAGTIVLVGRERVDVLTIEFGEAVALCEQLGRGSAGLHTTKSSASN